MEHSISYCEKEKSTQFHGELYHDCYLSEGSYTGDGIGSGERLLYGTGSGNGYGSGYGYGGPRSGYGYGNGYGNGYGFSDGDGTGIDPDHNDNT